MDALTRTATNNIFISLDEDGHSGDQGEGLYCHKIKFKQNNTLYEGVEFATRVTDTRDMEKELYDLHFKEGTGELLFFKPAMEMSLRSDMHLLEPRILDQDINDVYIVDGRKGALVSFAKRMKAKPDLERRKFEVFLPDTFKLSQRAFNYPIGKEGEFLSARNHTYMYRAPFPPAAGAPHPDTYHVYMSWRFINLRTDTELVLPGNNAVASLAAAYRGL